MWEMIQKVLYSLRNIIRFQQTHMDLFCDFEDVVSKEMAICSWQDSILAPKNQNITNIYHQKQQQIKPHHRRQNFISKRKINKEQQIQNIQNQICQHDFPVITKGHQREPSNFTKLKHKIENIDKDFDRWEEGSLRKVEKIPIGQYHRRVQSGVFKVYTEEQPRERNSMDRARFQSRSIQSQRAGQRIRPTSSRTSSCNNNNNEGIFANRCRQRAQTIHSKPRLKSHSYSKQLSKEKPAAGELFTINQLESNKVKHIIQCLSKRK